MREERLREHDVALLVERRFCGRAVAKTGELHPLSVENRGKDRGPASLRRNAEGDRGGVGLLTDPARERAVDSRVGVDAAVHPRGED